MKTILLQMILPLLAATLAAFLIAPARGAAAAAQKKSKSSQTAENYDYKCDPRRACNNWYSDDSLDCTRLDLTCIPNWFDPINKNMKFQHNKMRIIPDHIFRDQFRVAVDLAAVEDLDLSYNLLAQIAPKAFYGMNSLKALSLHYNVLPHVPKEALALPNMATLEKLILMGNPFGNLGNSEFSTLSNLLELDLRYCKLKGLTSRSFEGLEKLESLRLNGNELTIIKDFTFQHARKLTNLGLSDNEIQTLEENGLKGPDYLLNLDINVNNPIKLNYSRCLPCMGRWNDVVQQIPHDQSDNSSKSNETLWTLSLNSEKSLPVVPRNVFKHQFHGSESELLRQKLEFLVLSSKKIEIVEPGAFAGLPKLVYLNLDQNFIKNIPTQAWTDVSKLLGLSLKGNRIGKLGTAEFSTLSNLLKLDLRYCKLKGLTSRSFEGLGKLETLRLNGNELTIIKDNTFQHVRKLTNLGLSDNKIQTLEENGLKGPDYLFNLDINVNNPIKLNYSRCLPCMGRWNDTIQQTTHDQSDNSGKSNETLWTLSLNSEKNLPVVPRNVFKHQFHGSESELLLEKLQFLNLTSRKIEIVEPGAFAGLPKLEYLNLDQNVIKSVPTQAWTDVSNLLGLSLKGNPLGKLGPKVFVALSKLTKLDLEECSLDKIERDSFEGLGSLRDLSLANNKLTEIEPLTFSLLGKLSKLNLDNNLIHTLKPSAFGGGLKSLKVIDLRRTNPTLLQVTAVEWPGILGAAAGPSAPSTVKNDAVSTFVRVRGGVEQNSTIDVRLGCNCNEQKSLCAGLWKFDTNLAQCEVERTRLYKISKFAQVNVAELAASAGVLALLGFLIQRMLTNYNSSPL